MDVATEALQWDICVFCGTKQVLDTSVVEKLVAQGKTRQEAEEYVAAYPKTYQVCPNRSQHENAHPKGFPMVPEEQLEHGTYYHGKCRNAHIARWNAETKRFIYMREKFRYVFPEEIGYWAEAKPGEHRFDEFRPYGRLDAPPFEIPLTLAR